MGMRDLGRANWARRSNLKHGASALALLFGGIAPVPAAAQLAAADGPQLEEILITADRKKSFSANYVQAGTFRNARQLDTPLTVTVIPREIIEAQQATNLFDAVRNSAGVTMSQVGPSVASNLQARGINFEARSSYRLNGSLPTVNLIDLPLEDKERVEVLKGVAAIYYGFVPPSGIVNMTTKRPTNSPINDLTLFGNNHGTIGGHADMSRRFVDDKVGIRVNAVESGLDYGIDKVDGNRRLYAVAIDVDPFENFHVKLDAEHIHKKVSEVAIIRLPTLTAAQIAARVPLVLPPTPSNSSNLGDKWMYTDADSNNFLAHVDYKFLPNWSVTLEAGESYLNRDRRFPVFQNYNLATGAGTTNVTFTNKGEYRNVNYRAEFAGAFQTWILEHEISFGGTRNVRKQYVPVTNNATNLAQNLYAPIEHAEVVMPAARSITNPQKIDDKGLYVFDRMKYSDWLEMVVGVRRSIYSSVTAATGRYSAAENSPTGGAVIKVLPWLSFYGTYIEGLEEGGVAPLVAANANQTLPPALSTQWEVGIKAEPIDKLLLTLGRFSIDRSASFLNSSNVFVQDGRTTYEGFEFSATGEINAQFSVFATAMILDAKVGNTSDLTLIGKRPENTPRFAASLFAEYRTPWVEGLSLTAGMFHTGGRAVNAANQAYIPGYQTYDIGARYTTDIRGADVTFRFNIENLLDKNYYAATGSSLLATGLPRTAKFSTTFRF
ncbi:ligand-gated channel [Rhodospirillales bacterium TMPK1]|uniref:Ligand-gated channel n=2 Tax=Roseiterribacter gracilis TaxID=2812848 RepID=A0A8S8X8G8_9PROT|nr:ligand-gated channel [Rhodospirillales bacterium TMPK1]